MTLPMNEGKDVLLLAEGAESDCTPEEEVEAVEAARDEVVANLTSESEASREEARRALDDVAARLERMAAEIRKISDSAEFPIASNLERIGRDR